MAKNYNEELIEQAAAIEFPAELFDDEAALKQWLIEQKQAGIPYEVAHRVINNQIGKADPEAIRAAFKVCEQGWWKF